MPPTLAALSTALGVRYFPTQAALEILDEAWADHVAAKEVPSVFSVKSEEQANVASTSQQQQLDNLTSLMRQQVGNIQRLENIVHREPAIVSNIQPNTQQNVQPFRGWF